MTIYQVKDWDAHYENYKSRTVEECSFVCVPNSQDGMGLTRILAETDGAMIYGIFNLIVGACSRQRLPRMGYMTHDGRESGTPWTVADMALRWRRTREEVTRALEVLCSESVGWIVSFQRENDGTPAVSDQYPPGIQKGREGNERKEGNEKCGEPQAASPPPSPVLFRFPVAHRKGEDAEWPLCQSNVDELTEVFPGVQVLAECRKALAWVRANPGRKKTSRGMPKFLFGWMERATNKVQGPTQAESVEQWAQRNATTKAS